MYLSFQECGGILPIATSGEIKSPSYPNRYPPNLNCIWQIQVTAGHQVTATYRDIDIEPSSRCIKDYVRLQNGASASSPVLNTYCARALPAQISYVSSGNTMRVTFKSDSSGNGRGLRLIYNQTLQGITYTLKAMFSLYFKDRDKVVICDMIRCV